LNWYQGIAAVGIYTLATTIAEKQLIVLGAVNIATNYRIIGEERQNSEILMARILRTSILILFIICCIALTFGRWVIGLLYGPQFASTTHLLVILLPGTLSLGLASLISNYFSGQLGRPSITTGLSIAFLVVSVPCYHFLIRYLGTNGAALAISLIYLLHFTSLLILFGKMSGVPFKQAIFSNIHDLKFIYEGIKHRTVSPKMPLPNEANL
jgi:O-antigen/teichoic acid export membrane protein